MTGGPAQTRQRDRLLSMSAGRLDIIVTRLLPDGDWLPGGGKCLRVLGGAAKLDRAWREATQELFADGPARPGADPDFAVRLVSQFVPGEQAAFKTADGDEYLFCETTIDVAGTRGVWDRLTNLCIPAPEPPVLDIAGYDAYLAGLPPRFWTRNSDAEIEYVGLLDADRLTNLGTVERMRRGFKVTANSARRVADLTELVLDAAATVGQAGKVTRQSARTAQEMLGGDEVDDAPDGRGAACRRLGLDAALVTVPPREVILEEHFLPIERSAAGDAAAREINRELLTRAMLEARSYDGCTPAEAVKNGGAARDRVLAMIDDCEWRLANADSETATMMPRPADLRRRLGIR